MRKIIIINMLLIFITSYLGANHFASWQEGAMKDKILSFIEKVSNKGSINYVPPEQRIAVFDNDGTLWVEKPIYTEMYFVFARIKSLAKDHKEWETTDPFKAVLTNDIEAIKNLSQKDIQTLLIATHANMTTSDFADSVKSWVEAQEYAQSNQGLSNLTYKPMIEFLDLLREKGFKTFIVSGGTEPFIRELSRELYGISPENVVGTSFEVQYQIKDDKPLLWILPKINFIDDGPNKPVGIYKHIGQKPILAVGNSDGDLAMLEWTTSDQNSLALIVHHDDDQREFAYDRESSIGKLDEALKKAPIKGWGIISMKNDWKRIFKTSSKPPYN